MTGLPESRASSVKVNIALGILDRSHFTENSVTGTERMKRDMGISQR